MELRKLNGSFSECKIRYHSLVMCLALRSDTLTNLSDKSNSNTTTL
jgi:hypothetical protein